MKYTKGKFVYTTLHEFKNNISSYTRMLEKEHYRGVVVMRRNKEVGLYMALEPRMREEKSGLQPYDSATGADPFNIGEK